MGSLCVVSDKEPNFVGGGDENIPLTHHKSDTYDDTMDDMPIEEETESTENDEVGGHFNTMQFDAMQQEVIILSTRNANLEQQLEEMKNKFSQLKHVETAGLSQNFEPVLEFYETQMVPIGYICDELEIDGATLLQCIEIDQLETFLSEIDSNITKSLNQLQLNFLQCVSDDMNDNLLGLLNILIENNHYVIFYKCAIVDMVSFIYHEPDEEEEAESVVDDDGNEKEKEIIEYDIEFIYGICDVLNISRDLVNNIDTMIKQRLGSENKFENLFIQNQDSY